jgi:hypothetical protein
MTRKLGLALVIVLVAACGKKDAADKKEDKKGAPPAAIDVAGVNALVPAALKDKIVFEQRTVEVEGGRHKETYTLAAPKNWTQSSKMFANLKADDKGGFFSKMSVGTSCDGDCVAGKDWAKASDKEQFANRAKDKIAKDEKTANRRVMISTDESNTKVTNVTIAWWTDGAKHYFVCSADLDESVKDAASAFEKACSAVNVDGGD